MRTRPVLPLRTSASLRDVRWMLSLAPALAILLSLPIQLTGCTRAPTVEAPDKMVAAKAAIQRGDNKAAISALDQVLSIDPTHAEALVYRAQLARESGDDKAALALIRRVPPVPGPMAGTAKFLEGSLLLAAQDAGGAETCWRQSIPPTSTRRLPVRS